MMSENQWQQAADPYPADPYATAGTAGTGGTTGTTGTFAEQGGASTKKEAAKEEASNIAGEAKGAAQNVAGTAKAEAANVASEVKTNTKDLLNQAKSGLTDQAGAQQQKAAEGIRTISSQLRSMADAPEQQGVASDLIRQAAERSESVASWLDNRDPGSLLNEVKSFARQRPGTFLLIAAGAGLLAGRLGRSLQAGAPETGGQAATGQAASAPASQPAFSAPSAPTPIHQETMILGGGADRYFDEPTVHGSGAPASTQSLPAADTSLREDDDPFARVEGRHL